MEINFAEITDEAMLDAGMHEHDLAVAMGLPLATLCEVIDGNVEPTPEIVTEIHQQIADFALARSA